MDSSNVSVVQRRIYYLFSPFLRIFHWIMVDCICVLFVTGILIGKPLQILNFEPTATYLLMNVVRDLHFLAAFLLCASFVLKI